MAPQPRIVSRSQWGARTSIPGGRGVAHSQRRFFVVHWPVMSMRDPYQWCRDIESIHRNQGYAAAPGYNFLVAQDGQIMEGAGLTNRGIHCPNRNTDGFGVCMLQPSTAGGTPTAAISQAAKNSTRALYDWLCSVTGRTLTRTWHGAHFATACPGPDARAWVQAGMPATGGAPGGPEQPPAIEEVEMVASAVADSGVFNVFVVGPARGTIWDTWQRPNESGWQGGAPGKSIAGLRRFAEAPSGRTIRGIEANVAANGNLHVFATMDDGSTWFTWQAKGATGWSGGQPGRVAALSLFAPRPT
jgi:hypothetical protein